MTIADLKPSLIWSIFDKITKVPRPSKKEEKIRKFLIDYAKEHNIDVRTDEVGNVVMSKPATPGKEDAPCVILQGHMDMVCESNKPGFDFENNPITTIIDGEWVHADGTTLGADNGIGMAASLAVLTDDTLIHGPIEALFTVDEETGMTGANNLGEGMLTGTILLNLDSEDDGLIFVGCAGGIDSTITFTYEAEAAPEGYQFFRVDLTNGRGGHSGGDIHLGRANANKLLARYLYALSKATDVRLAQISGGNLRNAIPRDAHAYFGVPAADKEKARIELNKFIAEIHNEYKVEDPDIKLELESEVAPANVIDAKTSANIICSLYSSPHGVVSMSKDFEGIVETSTNLASVSMLPDNKVLVVTSQRSSVESRKYDIAHQVEAHFTIAGAEVTHGDGYPGWEPNMNSPIMHVVRDAYKELFDVEPEITSIHAGLECGLLGSFFPHLDMVSFGPTLRNVHSPSEMMHIPAVERFWKHLVLVLEKVADLKK